MKSVFFIALLSAFLTDCGAARNGTTLTATAPPKVEKVLFAFSAEHNQTSHSVSTAGDKIKVTVSFE